MADFNDVKITTKGEYEISRMYKGYLSNDQC